MHFSNHASPVRSSDVATSSSNSGESTPYGNLSPWNQVVGSPYHTKLSPWSMPPTQLLPNYYETAAAQLVGSLVREEGHVYSLATSSDLLYTGSDSKNIRVWKKGREFSGFKSSSGLVKAIVVAGNRIYTGHQDGKIRVWRVSGKDPTVHRRVGTLPKLMDYLTSSNYLTVVVRRKRKRKHLDAVSCLSLNEDKTILYSGSWDKTIKVWRLSDSKCLESIDAHDDTINSVVNGFSGGLLFSGSADGTVKLWRPTSTTWELGKSSKHVLVQTLVKKESPLSAVTSLAVSETSNLSLLYIGWSDGVVNWREYDKHTQLGVLFQSGGVLLGHKLAVLCLAAKGTLVLSGSADKTICVWNRSGAGAGGHTCLAVLRGHLGPVKCLAVEVDDNDNDNEECHSNWTVYSGSVDRSVNVWKVNLL